METSEKVLKAVAGVTLVAGGAMLPAIALAATQPAGVAAAAQAAGQAQAARVQPADVQVPDMQGDFSFSQDEVTPNSMIARVLYKASTVLCGSGVDSTNITAETAPDWQVTVRGDVEDSFTATIGDLAEQGAAKTVLGCTCTGNPAGGLATVNAKVTGVTLRSMLDAAGVKDDANTITFISDDGYTVSLPLSYVTQRYSIIVYEINGEALCDVGGSANQLWLGSTSARYFAQNVSQIVLSAEDEDDIPPIPGTPEAGDTYANRPNVSVTAGA